MPDTNTAQRRWEAGGVLKITDGVTEYVVKLVKAGSLRWKDGWYEVLRLVDRGVTQTPYEGDERPSEIEFEVHFTGRHAAADIAKHLSQRDTATGLVKLYTVVCDLPDFKGASVGQRLTWTGCYMVDGGVEVQTGQDFDTLKVKLESKLVQPTTATY